jgi:transcriptional regulator with XRE-family HTH domain
MSIKERRKKLGWDREELARRTALSKQIIQLAELGQWTEAEALGRLEYVLTAGENGEDIVLPPLSGPTGPVFGANGPPAGEG